MNKPSLIPYSVKSRFVNCDNHVITNTESTEVIKALENLGFSRKDVTGGDSRVRMKYLWSKKSLSLQKTDEEFDKIKFYMARDKSFIGYIEEEVTTADEAILYSPFNEIYWDSMLPKLSPVSCPEGIYKACDIHLAIHNINPKIEQKLLAAGFYYLELNKSPLGKVRIYTMQTQEYKVGKKIFKDLKKTLVQGGGVEGFLKFEVTRNIYNQGFSLPPLILS